MDKLAAKRPEAAEQPMPGQRTSEPPITLIIPAWNEEAYIETCLLALLGQVGCNIVGLIVADGGSTDRTIPIVEALSKQHPQIRLIHNPKRFQSAAINLAARQTTTSVFVRADAHMNYAPNYVKTCVDALHAQAATSVVVAMRTVGKTGFQRAVAAAQNSILGNGGAAHRRGQSESRFVDHGHHAAFDRAFFLKIGGYDETFLTCDDIELDTRAAQNGARIWLAADAMCFYLPRAKPFSLAKQYYRYGVWRVHLMAKHRLRPRLRQWLPAMLVLSIVFGFGLSFWWWPFTLPPLAYLASCFAMSMIFAAKHRDPWLLAAGSAAVIMHGSYGIGMLVTLLEYAVPSARRVTKVDNPHAA